MNNFMSFCVVAIRNVVLEENRKNFSIGFVPYDLDCRLHITNGVEQIICESGFEDFFKMLELEAHADSAKTNVNLINTGIKCNLIFCEGEPFAITSLSTSDFTENCFVFSEGKNYMLKEVKELAKKQKQQKLLSQIEMYSKKIQKTLKELSELENVPLSLVQANIDKIRNNQ